MTLPDGRQVTIPGASLLSTQVAPRQLSDVMRIRVYISDGWRCVFFNWYLENVCLSGGGIVTRVFHSKNIYCGVSADFVEMGVGVFLGGCWLVLKGGFIQSIFFGVCF